MSGKRTVHVTEHALVRYAERVFGVDMKAARSRIARKVANAIRHGAGAVTIDGVTYHLRQENVVTISVTENIKRRRRRQRARK
ncbi:MAG: hypothetical protein AAF568_03415 [Pseudomonadota bacterium]